MIKQESPPAWTQEAYRPPRSHSESLLFRGGGGPSTKIFFPSLNMYQAKSGVKNFSLYLGGGSLDKIFFSSLNMYQANPGVKNFSLYLGGGSLDENFFSGLNMYQAKSGVKNFSLYWVGGGGSLYKNFFSQSEHVSSQIWCQKFFPLLEGGSLNKKFFSSLNMYQAKSGVKIFSLYWDQVPPPSPPDLRPGIPPPRSETGTPPTWTWTPPPKVWTDWKYNLPSSFGCGW